MLARQRTWLLILILALLSCSLRCELAFRLPRHDILILSFGAACTAQESTEVEQTASQLPPEAPVPATNPEQDAAAREAAQRYTEGTSL